MTFEVLKPLLGDQRHQCPPFHPQLPHSHERIFSRFPPHQRAVLNIQVSQLRAKHRDLAKVHLCVFVTRTIASTSSLSRRLWTRLHVRDHSCFVIWVPESHICMQSTTALSCGDPGASPDGNVRVGVCANVAPAPKLRVTIAMRSKRMGRSWRTEKTAAEASRRKRATEG